METFLKRVEPAVNGKEGEVEIADGSRSGEINHNESPSGVEEKLEDSVSITAPSVFESVDTSSRDPRLNRRSSPPPHRLAGKKAASADRPPPLPADNPRPTASTSRSAASATSAVPSENSESRQSSHQPTDESSASRMNRGESAVSRSSHQISTNRKRKSTDPPVLSYYGSQQLSSQQKKHKKKSKADDPPETFPKLSWHEKIDEVYRHFPDLSPAPEPTQLSRNQVSRDIQQPVKPATPSLPPSDATTQLAMQLAERATDLSFDKQPSKSQFYRGATYRMHKADFVKVEGTPLDDRFKILMGKGYPSDQVRVSDRRLKELEMSVGKALQVSGYIHWFTATAARELPVLPPDLPPTGSVPIPGTSVHMADGFFDSLGEAILDMDRLLLWLSAQIIFLRRTAYIKQLPQNTESAVKDQLYSAPLFGETLFGEPLQRAIADRDEAMARKRNEDLVHLTTSASPRRGRPNQQQARSPRSPRTPRKRQFDGRNNFGNAPNTPRKTDTPRTPAKSPRRGRGQRRV